MILQDIRDLLLPRYCAVCGAKLARTESHVCVNCLRMLPLTDYGLDANNPVMQHFVGYPSVRCATAWFHYINGSESCRIIKKGKYHNQPDMLRHIAHCAASDLLPSGIFQSIDAIVPVPLSRARKMQRGYNQSMFIARGLSERTGIPIINDCLKRKRDNKHQARLSRDARLQNVQNLFYVREPQKLQDKHLLLVDDVITTGATLSACIEALDAAPHVRITVFALATAQH